MALEIICEEINYDEIEDMTTKTFVKEFKKEVERFTTGPIASEIKNIAIEKGKQYVVVIVNFHHVILISTFSKRWGDYTSKTITSGDYWLIKKLIEGDQQ